MLICTFDIIGISPISFSAPIQSKAQTGEGKDAFEQRTWRERMHVDSDGTVFIPPMAMKNCLSDAAQYLGESVPGKRTATYTKHFQAGIMCIEPMKLNVKADEVEGDLRYVPSDGKRGGGKRVWKTFPIIMKWRTKCTLHVLDPILIDKPEKVEEYLGHAGKFIGMGRFRPRNNGFYGRFVIENFKTSKNGL